MKIAIIGGPKTGKTTLAKQYESVLHSDDFISMGWSEASTYVASQMSRYDFTTFEGTAVVRALRKALEKPGKPVDEVIYLRKPHESLSIGQASMAAGIETIWQTIVNDLRWRGVSVTIHS